MTKIRKNPKPQTLEEGEVTLVESAEGLTNPELLKVSRHVRVRMGANGATDEIDALLVQQDDSKTAVRVHEAGSRMFPQWSNTGKGIWTSPQAHEIARVNRRWGRTGETGHEQPPAGSPIDPHAKVLSWPVVKPVRGPGGRETFEVEDTDGTGYAMEHGITLE